MGLLCALTVGGLLLVFLVLRGRLDALAAELRAARRDVEGVGKGLDAIDARAAAALVEVASARDRLAVDEGAEEVEGRASVPVVVDLGAQLDPLHEELGRTRRELQGLTRRVGELATELEHERARRLGETIRERFERQGFQSIRVLADPSLLEGGDARVPLEGMKGGITYKGYVVVEDGRIVDEKMTSSYEVFP